MNMETKMETMGVGKIYTKDPDLLNKIMEADVDDSEYFKNRKYYTEQTKKIKAMVKRIKKEVVWGSTDEGDFYGAFAIMGTMYWAVGKTKEEALQRILEEMAKNGDL